MSYENLIVEHEGPIAIITISRPKALNALNHATLTELAQALREVEQSAELRVALITGGGEKAFVAGADIGELRALPDAEATRAFADLFHVQIGQFIAAMTKPVIAVVNGFALGGGCELALACDIRLAADTARLALPEINLGIIPGWGGTQRMPRLVGASMAKLLALTGEMIDAAEALRIGLVDRVYPADELRPAAIKLATTLASKAPLALAAVKRAINQGVETSLDQGINTEAGLFSEIIQTADAKEGTSAFLEKRQAVWQGR